MHLKVNKKLWDAREREVVEKKESDWRSWVQKPKTKVEQTTSATVLDNTILVGTETIRVLLLGFCQLPLSMKV